ncbi:MAG: polar localization protein TipN, partial [Caulobacter sp.]|nr:polar localization protein TipN [Caulobacter sp.]
MKAKKRPLLDFSAVAPAPLMVRTRIKPYPDAPDDDDLDIREQPAILSPPILSPGITADVPPLAEAEPPMNAEDDDLELAQAIDAAGTEAPKAAAPTVEPPAPPPMNSPVLSSDRLTPAAPGGSRAAIARIKDPAGWPIYLVAAGIAVIWAIAPIAFAVGYRRDVTPLSSDPLAMAVFALLAIGPALFVMLAAFVLHQGMKLATEAKRSKMLSETMLLPAAMAAADTGSAVESVRGQIAEASAEAARAREAMLAMQQVLAHETGRLADAAAHSTRTATALAETLGRQRGEMAALATTLDAQSAGVGEAITRQGRMVTEAADLAVAQIAEAEAALAARAADLAAAAGEASDAARVAGEDLSRQVGRLETAGVGVGDQMRMVEESLTEQRAGLVTVAHAMRADHEDFAAQIETRQAQLGEVIAHARMSAAELSEKSGEGAEALRAVIAEAASQLSTLVETVHSEREALDAESARMVSVTADVASRERDALAGELQASIEALGAAANDARLAAEGHVGAAQGRIDDLNEAAFAAAQKADAIFETRLNEARALIAQSSQLMEHASTQTLTALATGVTEARETLAEMQALLAQLDERTASLPEEARSRAEAVTASVQKNMTDLLETARRASEETQAIDAAFQERVKRNYEMLTEAAKLMGAVSGAAGNVSATSAALRLP